MQRIQAVNGQTASDESKAILDEVRKTMGGVPNLISTMAQSAAVAKAYLAFNQALSGGGLCPKLREGIALAVGEENSCRYCVSAHTVLGARAGLCEAEIEAARRGTSEDPAVAAALKFVRKLVADRGNVCDSCLEEIRKHGFSDGDIAELVAHVALNTFTNYFNHVAGTEIDFPVAAELVG